MLLALRCIESVEPTTELRTPCLQERYVVCDIFCIGWNIIAVDDLRSAKHVSNCIPSTKKTLSFCSHDQCSSEVVLPTSAGDR